MVETEDVRMTLNFILDQSKKQFGDLGAIGMALQSPLTYSQFHDQVMAIAFRLQQEGVKKNDHVAILAENSHHWGAVYFAIVRLGAVVVPILPDLPEADVHHILSEMKVSILVARHLGPLVEIFARTPRQPSRIGCHPDVIGQRPVVAVGHIDYACPGHRRAESSTRHNTEQQRYAEEEESV